MGQYALVLDHVGAGIAAEHDQYAVFFRASFMATLPKYLSFSDRPGHRAADGERVAGGKASSEHKRWPRGGTIFFMIIKFSLN